MSIFATTKIGGGGVYDKMTFGYIVKAFCDYAGGFNNYNFEDLGKFMHSKTYCHQILYIYTCISIKYASYNQYQNFLSHT